MALTFSKVDAWVAGDREFRVYDVTFDSAYPAGGEAVTAANFGLDLEITHILGNVLRDPDTADNAYLVDFDEANSKLVVLGGDYDPAAQGPFIEVSGFGTPITDLSAYTARLLVIGK